MIVVCVQMFGTSLTDMSDHLDQGDVADTVKVFFEKSTKLPPQSKSTISIQEVDAYLEQMSKVTKEEDQQSVLTAVAKRYVLPPGRSLRRPQDTMPGSDTTLAFYWWIYDAVLNKLPCL